MFKTKCPRCGGTNINSIKEGFGASLMRNLFNVMLPIRFLLGYAKRPHTQYVCRDDGFTWMK